MNSNRSAFLDALIKASPELETMFLNFTGNPSRMLTDLQCIEILVSKKSFRNFQEFALSHPLISKLDVISQFHKKEVWASFIDGTALHFMFFHKVISHGISLIDTKEFLASGVTNEFGMLVPSRQLQYEFQVLQVQFEGNPMPDRFRLLFSGLDDVSRRVLFNHIQPRYDLVMSVIEDLYEPSGHIRYRIIVAQRHTSRNSLFNLAVRVIAKSIFSLTRLFTPRSRTLIPDPGQQKNQDSSAPALKKAQGS